MLFIFSVQWHCGLWDEPCMLLTSSYINFCRCICSIVVVIINIFLCKISTIMLLTALDYASICFYISTLRLVLHNSARPKEGLWHWHQPAHTLRSTFCWVCSAQLNVKVCSGLVPHALPYCGWQKLGGGLGARLDSLTLLYWLSCWEVRPSTVKKYILVWFKVCILFVVWV